MKNDAEKFDGKPFSGKIVAEYFGNQGAAIAAVARILSKLITEGDKMSQGKRKEFTLTKEWFEKLLNASKPVPLIALNCGRPRSPQENANSIWQALGEEFGFEYMSVLPNLGDKMKFTAEVAE